MKSMNLKKWASTAIAAASLLTLSQNANAVAVDLELSLVIDVSGSINAGEFSLQQTGYASAFQSAAVSSFIQDLADAGTGGIAVNVIFFSTTSVEKITWTQLDSAADSIAFGNAIAGLSRTPPSSSFTNIANGMALSLSSFTNSFEGNRLTMDVSGDGKQNRDLNGGSTACTNTAGSIASVACTGLVDAQRDAADLAGITVNGLSIGDANLESYFNTHVRTADGFVNAANNFADFGEAARNKIIHEITGVPEPTIVTLLGLGLIGLGLSRKQRRNS